MGLWVVAERVGTEGEREVVGGVQSKFKTEIIIQQRKKESGNYGNKFPIQIFPQNMQGGSLTYYPYFFSTNMECNYYNYFPSALPAFLPPLSSNMVYAPQPLLPAPLSAKTCHLSPSLLPNSAELPETQNAINNSQPQPQEVVQLCNRNVLPNNVSLILCFIRRVKKSGRMVDRIIARLSPEGRFTSKRFYAYQLYLKENCTDFKWKEGIEVLVNHLEPSCASFSLEEQAFYNKLTRILISEYLERICRLEVLNHTKINPTHIRDHLRVIRYIRQTLRGPNKPKMSIQYL